MTSPVKIYGLKRCSTCVKATKWLEANGVTYTFVDYRDNPVPPATLVEWAQSAGGWEKLINRASTTWRNLSDVDKAASTPEAFLALIAQAPTLVKRPVLVSATGPVMLGFSEKKYSEVLG